MEENRQNPEIEERNATLDDDPIASMTEDELQERILEDSGMNAFQKFCARMSEARWILLQRIVGAFLGMAAGVALFWDMLFASENAEKQQGMFSMPLIIAIVIAMIVPNIIEKQGLRRVPKLRIAMVISLAIFLVVFFVISGLRSGFSITT